MKYEWLAHHLVRRRYPELNEQTENQIVSEAVCRAWCSCRTPDYRVMQSCVDGAAKRKGLFPATAQEPPCKQMHEKMTPETGMPHRTVVLHMSDYR